MTINRDNYEEFFILYGDNELGSGEKILVEEFVKANPDLQAEFDLLNQLRFTPDEEVSFDNKEALMQSSGLTRNEELMLLSIDKELDASQQAEFEQLLSRDANLRSELALYKKASFDPNERIVFPHKELLYRREEKTKVIPMGGFNWRKLAAAAAILVAVSVTAFVVFNGRDGGDDPSSIAGTTGTSTTGTNGTGTDGTGTTGTDATGTDNGAGGPGSAAGDGSKTVNDSNTGTVPSSNDQLAQGGAEKATRPDGTKEKTQRHFDHNHDSSVGTGQLASGNKKQPAPGKSQLPVNRVLPVKPGGEVAKAHNNLPRPSSNPNVTNVTPDNSQLAVNIPVQKQVISGGQEKNTFGNVTSAPSDPYIIVSNPVDPVDDFEEMGPSSKKTKLRGFFRKVTRTFEKNTNIKATDDEDRLLVGGLAIRL